jgi:lambda repressor-like predicted transcriptional regulator
METGMSSEHENTVGDIASSLKTAGTLVAKQAERTQVTKVTLQSAYAAFGKAVFKDAAERVNDFETAAERI